MIAPWYFFATNDSQTTQCENPHEGRSFMSAASLQDASRFKSPTLTFPARRLTDLSQPRMNIQTRYPGGDPMAYLIRCTLKFASTPDCTCRGSRDPGWKQRQILYSKSYVAVHAVIIKGPFHHDRQQLPCVVVLYFLPRRSLFVPNFIIFS